jgi:hypothetical protein
MTYEIQDLALDNEIMEAIHHLLDTGVPVPPMHVEDVDVCSAQFLKTGLHTDVQRFEIVSGIVHLQRDVIMALFVVAGVLYIWVSNGMRRAAVQKNLGRKDKLIPDVTLLSPFAAPS